MTDLWREVERAIGPVVPLHQLELLLREFVEACDTDRRVCGNCIHWLHFGACPRETLNKQGHTQGPGRDAPACPKFALEPCVAALKAKRMAEVERKLNVLCPSRVAVERED